MNKIVSTFFLFVFVLSIAQDLLGQDVFKSEKEANIERIKRIESGYLDAKIIQLDTNYVIEKGNQFVIKKIHFNDFNAKLNHLEMMNEVEIPFTKTKTDSILTLLSNQLKDDFRLSSVAELDSIGIKHETSSVELYLKISHDRKTVINQVHFDGAKRYSSIYLERLSGFYLMDKTIDSWNKTEKMTYRLKKSGFFSEISTPYFFGKDSVSMIAFRLEEQNPNRFDLIAGYVPNVNGGGDFIGSVDVDLFHLLSLGNQVKIKFNRMQSLRTRFNAMLKQQYLFNSPFSVSGLFNVFQRDSTFQSVAWTGSILYDLSLNQSISIQVRNETIGTGVSGNGDITNGSGTFYGFEYQADYRNDSYLPTKGIYLKLFTEFGAKKNDLDSTETNFLEKEEKQRFQLEFSAYQSFFRRNIFVLKLQSNWLFSNFYQDSDLIRFGGASSFRGYAEEQFAVSNANWSDIEYRFLLDKNSFLFSFYSFGFINTPKLITQTSISEGYSNQIRSFGLGLAYRSRLGLLTFTYAKSPEDSFDNAKVHFSISGGLQ